MSPRGGRGMAVEGILRGACGCLRVKTGGNIKNALPDRRYIQKQAPLRQSSLIFKLALMESLEWE